jgi:hypothetical protein
MRRAYETLCPYERTYERENINAVLRLVQGSKIQSFTRTIHARAMLTTVPAFVPLLCASAYHSRPSSRSPNGQKNRCNRAFLVSHGLERSRPDGMFTIAKHEVVGSIQPITFSISSLARCLGSREGSRLCDSQVSAVATNSVRATHWNLQSTARGIRQ